jgi:integrase
MRQLNRLSDRSIRTKPPGMHHDGGGLYLQITEGRSGINKSWLFRYTVGKKSRYLGLGIYPFVGLSDAREKAGHARKLLGQGIDPIAHKHAARAALRQQSAKVITFGECADTYVRAHRAGWRSVRHATNWVRSLEVHVTPVLGGLPVSAIDTALVMKVLEPIWLRTPELASHVRGRMELILDWATAREYRRGDNPARWRGHLDKLLPSKTKVAPVVHHPALPYDQQPAFVRELRARDATAARVLEFVILTAARSAEVLGMKWGEVDFLSRVWTVPAERMKAAREHRVPLSDAAMALLVKLPRDGEYVFSGGRRPRLSAMAMHALLIRMKRNDITIHGFRSSFRDWAAERTNYPSEVAELALAHNVGNKVEAAYRRTDMFDRRRRLMSDWADFCNGKSMIGAEVIPIRA